MTQAAVWLPARKDLMGEVASLCGEITGSREDVCDICIILCSRLKMALKCSTFTTCSQLICPKHVIPFYIPEPLQLKKKHLAVTSPLLTPIILCLSFIFPSLPSSAYFRYAISFLSFSCVSLAVPQCTLLKCIFSNHSSKANCLPREPEPCPMLQEITVRLSRTR